MGGPGTGVGGVVGKHSPLNAHLTEGRPVDLWFSRPAFCMRAFGLHLIQGPQSSQGQLTQRAVPGLPQTTSIQENQVTLPSAITLSHNADCHPRS